MVLGWLKGDDVVVVVVNGIRVVVVLMIEYSDYGRR
jgi:hypothetical protein